MLGVAVVMASAGLAIVAGAVGAIVAGAIAGVITGVGAIAVGCAHTGAKSALETSANAIRVSRIFFIAFSLCEAIPGFG